MTYAFILVDWLLFALLTAVDGFNQLRVDPCMRGFQVLNWKLPCSQMICWKQETNQCRCGRCGRCIRNACDALWSTVLGTNVYCTVLLVPWVAKLLPSQGTTICLDFWDQSHRSWSTFPSSSPKNVVQCRHCKWNVGCQEGSAALLHTCSLGMAGNPICCVRFFRYFRYFSIWFGSYLPLFSRSRMAKLRIPKNGQMTIFHCLSIT